MTQICRTCFKESETADYLEITDDEKCSQVKIQMLLCIPEVDLNLLNNPILCKSCLEALNASYRFKKLCLYTEERIRSYLRTTKSYDGVKILDVYKSNSLLGLVFNSNEFRIGTPKRNYLDDLNDLLDDALSTKDEVDLNITEESNFTDFMSEESPPIEVETKDDLVPIKVEPTVTPNNDQIVFDTVVTNETLPKIQEIRSNYNVRRSSTKLLNCNVCTFKTKRPTALHLHKKEHVNKNLFSCRICNFKSPFKQYLQKHLEGHEVRDKTTVSVKEVKRATLCIKSAYECKTCSYQSKTADEFRKHATQKHHKKVFLCTKCRAVLLNVSAFKQHLDIHLGDNPVPVYKCKHCSYSTMNQYGYSGHMRRHKSE